MPGFFIRMLISAFGLWLAAVILPGVEIIGLGTLLLAALLLGFVNAFVRPLIVLMTLPVTILTLGLFLLFINAAMFGLVAAFLDAFQVAGVFSALFGSLIVSLTAGVASWTIGPDGRYEVIVIERRID
jgi:putative membrane protein